MSKPFSNEGFRPPHDNNNRGTGGPPGNNGGRVDNTGGNRNSTSQRAAQHARCMQRVRTVIEDVMTILDHDQEMQRSIEEADNDEEEAGQQRNQTAPSDSGTKRSRRNPRNPRERDQ